MKKTALLTLTATAVATTALAQAPATPPSWNNATLSKASYVIMEPVIEGNAGGMVNAEQMAQIVTALKHDSAGAIMRHYPSAQIVTDVNTPGAIKVTPTFVTPSALAPWAKLTATMTLDLPDGRVQLVDTFSVLTLWQQGWNVVNYAADKLVAKMP